MFPRLVVCDLELFGVTGSFTKASGLCTLPINIVNEKIYLVLWLTFIAASLVSLLQLLHQALFLAPVFRPYVIPRLSSSTLVSRKVIRVVWSASVHQLVQSRSGEQADDARLLRWHGNTRLFTLLTPNKQLDNDLIFQVLLQLIASNCDTSQFSALVQQLTHEQRLEFWSAFHGATLSKVEVQISCDCPHQTLCCCLILWIHAAGHSMGNRIFDYLCLSLNLLKKFCALVKLSVLNIFIHMLHLNLS